MSEIKILIIEDELIIAQDIKLQLEKMGYTVTGIAKSYEKALQLLGLDTPDLMLIDIKLKGEKDGIDLASKVKGTYDFPIIFITSHADSKTVERAKKVHPNGYLVKPFEKEDLYTSIEIAIANYIEKKAGPQESRKLEDEQTAVLDDSIFVKKDHLLIKIRFDELQWIMAERNYLELHCDGKQHLIRSTLQDFLDKLPSTMFFQVHRSFAINLKHLTAIEHTLVRIENQEIPLGRSFAEPLKEKLKIIS
jgi:two-component system, LytTR family, response regulator LytT